jgi:mannosyltransferase OCH1-like enzyme
MYSLCLNMIVKNESHIITQTLEKLYKKIKFDYWVISDTGSTDNTIQLIADFFKKLNIRGEMHQDEWVDFSHNRNIALNHAFRKSKYVLIFDADDEICGDFALPSPALTKDSYQLQFGSSSGVSYTRTQIVNNAKRWKYVGVLHEYITSAEPQPSPITEELITGNYYTISGRLGNRSLDTNKYYKDAIVLENAYAKALAAKDEIYCRYGFYCANSFYDAGMYASAITWYKKTLENNNWAQEKYVSCLNLYNCYNKLNNKEAGFFYLVKSAEYDTERHECYYELIKYYCGNGLNNIAYAYYSVVSLQYADYLTNGLKNKLFLDNSISEFYLPYYLIIVSEKMRDYQLGIRMYKIIFTKKYKTFDTWYIGNMLHNFQFFIDRVKECDYDIFALFKSYIHFLISNNYPIHMHDFMNKYEKYISGNGNAGGIVKVPLADAGNKILIYTGFMSNLWNDTYVSTHAIGGSEKAVAYLVKQLPKSYDIIVSGDVEDEVVENVRYINRFRLKEVLNVETFHTIIISRFVSFFLMFPTFKCHQLYLSAHDTGGFLNNIHKNPLSTNTIIETFDRYIDGAICLTEWHKVGIIKNHPCLKNKMSIINNGINAHLSAAPQAKIRNKFIWTSCSYRGLGVLLHLWGDILQAMPDATLDISSYDTFPKPNCNKDAEILALIQKHSASVKHHGNLNTAQLHDMMSKAEYWLYTTTFEETSCITALEMLLHDVVCLYYPVAGLVDTMKGYGIQVKRGNEIVSIMGIGEERKAEMRIRGRGYAMSCSWENRAKEWSNTLMLTGGGGGGILHVAIFNSFNFHYEMFGYIIQYFANKMKSCNINISIFTETDMNMGWLDFYKKHFGNVFKLHPITEFYENKNEYDFIFVTTDDDYAFNTSWITNKCISINHTSKIRRPEYNHQLYMRPLVGSASAAAAWALPCFDIFKSSDKLISTTSEIHIACFYSTCSPYDEMCKIISRLCGGNFKIVLHFFGRLFPETFLTDINNNIKDIKLLLHEGLNTLDMMDVLLTCDYILTDHQNKDHRSETMSGSVPLAFSTLTPLIISAQNNNIYKFKNVIEYDVESTDAIQITKHADNVTIIQMELERKELTSMFEQEMIKIKDASMSSIPKKIIQTWEHKTLHPEFQKIVDTWKLNNPTYDYYLFDNNERLEFIKTNFNSIVLDTYKSLNAGAHKADFFRYCYLYICGGVYVDIDTLCIGNLNDFLLPTIEFIVPTDLNISTNEGKHNLFNTFIATIPKHPILLECINRIVYNFRNNIILPSKLDFTGPGVLGRSVNTYLGNRETDSFINKEGIINNIYFLKFKKDIEYVTDLNNNILFQNKNGNASIQNLYNNECNKLKNYVCWVSCSTDELYIKPINRKNIALMVYGQFRSYKNNLKENIKMLEPILKTHNIHVFVLTDKLSTGNYSYENEKEIREIFKEYYFNLHIFDYIENYDTQEEIEINNTVFDNVKHDKGITGTRTTCFINFLIYRKYLLNNIKNEYIRSHNINIDLTIICRLFDMKITNNLSFQEIENKVEELYKNKNQVFGSSDSFFIGSQDALNYLFELSEKNKHGNIYHDDIWEDSDFVNFVFSMESCLCHCRATYAPEIQYIAHMYYSNYEYINIRVDYNNPNNELNKTALYNVIHDIDRYK